MKFTKIPVQIEAFRVETALACASKSWSGLPIWLAAAYERGDIVFLRDSISIRTLEGLMTADRSDWIIQGVKGELYPCKPDIFALTYKPEVVDAGTVAMGLTPADIDAAIVGSAYQRLSESQVIVCELRLRNGAKVLGYNYGSIDPAAQDWVRGEAAAFEMAREKVWELEGYLLRERLASLR